jgi:signal peptidase I
VAKSRARRKRKSAPSRSEVAEAGAEKRPQSTRTWLWEWAKSISVAVLLFLVIRTFVVEAFKIPTGSMENTLLVGDWLLVNKAVYGAQVPFTNARLPAFSDLERRDVIVFKFPLDESESYVKRLIGLPGDTLAMREGELYVNGVLQDEPYVQHIQPASDRYDPSFAWQGGYLAPGVDVASYHPTRDNWGPIVVPPGKYFAMGDNRDDSLDSRYWGFVEHRLIKGQPLFIYYSYDAEKLRPLPWLTEIRWKRVGDVVR